MDIEIAKMTSQGQITIPLAIRKQLGLKDGDKVVFYQESDKLIMDNASIDAFRRLQKAFEGAAEELGLKDEQDVVDMVKEIREKRKDRYKCE